MVSNVSFPRCIGQLIGQPAVGFGMEDEDLGGPIELVSFDDLVDGDLQGHIEASADGLPRKRP